MLLSFPSSITIILTLLRDENLLLYIVIEYSLLPRAALLAVELANEVAFGSHLMASSATPDINPSCIICDSRGHRLPAFKPG